ncbi:efflux RND transporter periplasmic adaptor subunit [Fulvivirga kasyanovii]|uniref:Efflux RND transporter periplasmic adaptor subunit n=1 Tax=Fulvivirga kasyanovii TaxID=396812 RepID=A0ABW9RPS1_9BACT|nr:efflux RND transporter periplasmic adaptor subunit [Fulvivirga kasyanovii]MTI26153.1 efflux RND transporter periplasmic adaptor subunit [Fulvivirga kasyanovii]
MKLIKINGIFLAGLITMISCTANAPETEDISKNTDTDNTITLTKEQFTSSLMAMDTFSIHSFPRSVAANGTIDVPPENKASISAYFGGYVKEINLLPGQPVKQGQVLFTLENPEYINMQKEYLQAKSLLSYLKADYERQKELARDRVTSQKNFLKAESDYNVTLANYESLKKSLSLMNINTSLLDESNIRSTITVTAPISGFITRVNAVKGMFLNPADIAVSITNTEHLHLELSIFEKDIPSVSEGQPVKFRIQDDNREHIAHVHLIGKTVDMTNRTISVHAHLDDEAQQTLTPGMYVEAEIMTSAHPAAALPEEAVVNIEEKSYVLVKKAGSDGSIILEKREVETGLNHQGYIEISNSKEFAAGSEFLVKGAFNLIVE